MKWLVASALVLAACVEPENVEPGESMVVVAQRIGLAKRTGERSMGLDISPGINIDNRVSNRTDAEGCNKLDFVSPEGEMGIDNAFTFLFEAIEGLFEEGTVEALIQESIRSGRLLVMLKLDDVDDMENDDHVVVSLFSGDGTPIDSSGVIVEDQTFDVLPDSPISIADGRIVDGVLEAGPVEVTVPVAILNVFFDLEVRNAQLRAEPSKDGRWRAYIGGAVRQDTIYEVAAMADAMQGDQVTPLLESFLPMWVDLEPNEEGECEALSATLQIDTINAFLYPDTTL